MKLEKEIKDKRKIYNREWMRKWRHGEPTKDIKGVIPPEIQKNLDQRKNEENQKIDKKKIRQERKENNVCSYCGKPKTDLKFKKANFCSIKCFEAINLEIKPKRIDIICV